MHAPLLTAVLLILAAPAAATGATTFYSPAQVGGPMALADASWAFLTFDEGVGQASWASADLTNTTRLVTIRANATPLADAFRAPSPPESRPWTMGPDRLALASAGRGPAHLLVEAESIRLSMRSQASLFVPLSPSVGHARPGGAYHNYIDRPMSPESVALASPAAEGLLLEAHGVRYVQWAGLRVRCHGSSECPGGAVEQSYAPTTGGVSLTRFSVEEAVPADAHLTFETGLASLAVGGDRPSLQIGGWARLPLATGPDACDSCGPEKTLTIEGNATLAGIRRLDERHMGASLDGQAGTLHSDERFLTRFPRPNPAHLGAAGGTLLALLGAWRLLARLLGRDPLDHDRRRQLYDYIRGHPGATFREMAGALRLFQASLARHLHVLKRSHLIVEHADANAKRFFPNNGAFDRTWRQVALLRDPRNQALVDALRRMIPCSQATLVRAMREQGWRRATVQYRLRKLEVAGIVLRQARGRQAVYVLPPATAEQGPAPAAGIPV